MEPSHEVLTKHVLDEIERTSVEFHNARGTDLEGFWRGVKSQAARFACNLHGRGLLTADYLERRHALDDKLYKRFKPPEKLDEVSLKVGAPK